MSKIKNKNSLNKRIHPITYAILGVLLVFIIVLIALEIPTKSSKFKAFKNDFDTKVYYTLGNEVREEYFLDEKIKLDRTDVKSVLEKSKNNKDKVYFVLIGGLWDKGTLKNLNLLSKEAEKFAENNKDKFEAVLQFIEVGQKNKNEKPQVGPDGQPKPITPIPEEIKNIELIEGLKSNTLVPQLIAIVNGKLVLHRTDENFNFNGSTPEDVRSNAVDYFNIIKKRTNK